MLRKADTAIAVPNTLKHAFWIGVINWAGAIVWSQLPVGWVAGGEKAARYLSYNVSPKEGRVHYAYCFRCPVKFFLLCDVSNKGVQIRGHVLD